MNIKTVKNVPINHRFDGWSLEDRNPEVIKSFLPFWQWLYKYYFRVTTDGWENIPSFNKMLIVGTHNGGFAAPDMLMFMYDWYKRFGTERLSYGLMHPQVWRSFPFLAPQAVQCGAIIAHPKMAIAALRKNASVLVYPGGAEDVFRPNSLKNKIHFAGRKGFIKLAIRESVPILPAISKGAHDSIFVLAEIYQQLKQLHQWGMPWLFDVDPIVFPIYLGLPWGLAIGPLPNIPLPVQIHTRVCPLIEFPYYGEKFAKDQDYVNDCYEKVCKQMQWELDQLVNS
ncbi:MAG TPA: lysophospholipid acyltransferase family protein [Allocoleopsis sp.]